MTTLLEPETPPRRPAADLRAIAVFAVAVVLGGVGGFALTELLGVGQLRWGETELSAIASTVGSLVVGLVAGRLLLGAGAAMTVRAPGPVTGWPGSRFGAASLILAPSLLLAGEVVRAGYDFFFPAQLAAMAGAPGTILTSYGLYTAGLVLMIPAFLALTGLIGRERPGWAFWGATIAIVGSTVRIFQDGISFLALQLVPAQGLETATRAVGGTYQAWYVLQTLDGSDNLAWAVLAIGAYRARVLGWVPALGVSFMLTHYSGVLKGADFSTLTGAVLLAAVFVPLGVSLWRRAEPVSRKAWWGGVASVVLLAAQYLFTALNGFHSWG
ncbi:hypothetical protein [Amycolatopsis saalfeldensis]|uniref:Uncharacterized protein n=1 Tax=Amycolatopsis saalfeldensis TaxID=394193 RepID=A0A1H8QUV7_9PSEU|nr:hypothetical protein [Amycolatopsis saalfeldensis]SEO57731.1 hypothetical protein SAMN04489732_101493 [Amycolatopsis saalfeldensis]